MHSLGANGGAREEFIERVIDELLLGLEVVFEIRHGGVLERNGLGLNSKSTAGRRGDPTYLGRMKLKSMLVWLVSALSLSAAGLKVGDALPELSGLNQEGKTVKIEAAKGHEWLLIFSYPKALTPG